MPGPDFTQTAGGVVAKDPRRRIEPLLLAPSTTGEINTVQEEILPAACVRIDDLRFDFDSSFLGPEVSDELKLLKQLRDDVPGMPLSVFGHGDPVGDDVYNKVLSGRRAQAVYGLLTRKTELWEDLYKHPHGGDDWRVDSLQVMLTTLGHYAGPINGKLDTPTKDAVEAFQRSPAGAGLEPDRDPGELTREKLFRAYMDRLCVDSANKPFQLDPVADFVAHGADAKGKGDFQGCSEFNPQLVFSQKEDLAFRKNPDKTERNKENLVNRRVLLFLFRPGFRISSDSWPCPRAKEGGEGRRKRFFAKGEGDRRRTPREERRKYEDTQDTFACRFYDRLALESPCELGGPPVQSHLMTLQLRLRWTDPLDNEHDFPPTLPVTIVFPDGQSVTEPVRENGTVSFVVDQRKQSLKVVCRFTEKSFIGTAPANAADIPPEQFLTTANVIAQVDKDVRIFLLPSEFSGTNSDWTAKDTTVPFVAGGFTNLESLGDLVSATLVVNPHWQFFKFTYFDRKLKKRLSVPPLVIEGFRASPFHPGGIIDPFSSTEVDTQSNWTVQRDEVQCLPWILQDPKKPDKEILIQFRTLSRKFGDGEASATFVDSSQGKADGSGRTVVNEGPADNTQTDVGLNSGKHTTVQMADPNAARLAFYDLPVVWRSHRYFTRRNNKPGAFFEEVVTEGQSVTSPLAFSLDDLVLAESARSALKDVGWTPAKRVALFDNGLRLYKPDTGNKRPFLTVRAALRPGEDANRPRNYIDDHPEWVRVLVAEGFIHDVFDNRTPVGFQVVGARAAVRHEGTFIGFHFVSRSSFIESHNFHNGIGDGALALLRCCDGSGDTETAAIFHYFQTFFDHQSLKKADEQHDWNNKLIRIVEDKWNDSDRVRLVPQPGGAPPKVEIRVRHFHQWTTDSKATGQLNKVKIDKDVKRENSGLLGLDVIDGDQTVSVATHEAGHWMCLGDEYVEVDKHCSYGVSGHPHYKPGEPYFLDDDAMMRGNRTIRPRHYWPYAEFLLDDLRPQSTPFQVQRKGERPFRLPFRRTVAETRNFTQPSGFLNWPIKMTRDADNRGKGRFDLFLYPLGEEPYAFGGLKSGVNFQGLLSIAVKMRFGFKQKKSFSAINDFVTEALSSIRLRFRENQTVGVRGTNFKACFIFVTPRFLVDNFTNNKDYHERIGLEEFMKDHNITDKEKAYAAMVEDVLETERVMWANHTPGSHGKSWHYTVVVDDRFRGRKRWVGGTPEAKHTLEFEFDDPDEFGDFFAEMLGLPRGAKPTLANYAGIASFLDGGTTVAI